MWIDFIDWDLVEERTLKKKYCDVQYNPQLNKIYFWDVVSIAVITDYTFG